MLENLEQQEASEQLLLKRNTEPISPQPSFCEPTSAVLYLATYPAAQRAFDQEMLVTWVELGSTDRLEIGLQQTLMQGRHWVHKRK